MTTTVGQVKVVELAYDNKGKSKGIATVIFRQKGSAQKAFEQCESRAQRGASGIPLILSCEDNNRMIDQS